MADAGGGTGDLELSPFAPCSAVVLAELPAAERRRYLELLASRDCCVVREGGAWVANLRILAPGLVAAARTVAGAVRAAACTSTRMCCPVAGRSVPTAATVRAVAAVGAWRSCTVTRATRRR